MGNKIATVFGGGGRATNTKEYQETILMGHILGKNGYTVKSGGYYGIMEAISKGTTESGGKSIGVTCKLFPSTKGNKFLTETTICDDIYDRLRILIEETSIFIIQKGGIGTLSELFLTLDIIRKKEIKPKVILVGDFWKDIMISLYNLFNKNESEMFIIISDYKEIENYV